MADQPSQAQDWTDRSTLQRLTFRFFMEHARSQEPFTYHDLRLVTGWETNTISTYASKQWKQLLDRSGRKLRVRPEFTRFSEEAFLALCTQKRSVYATYGRVRYDEVIVYEFLLPLTESVTGWGHTGSGLGGLAS